MTSKFLKYCIFLTRLKWNLKRENERKKTFIFQEASLQFLIYKNQTNKVRRVLLSSHTFYEESFCSNPQDLSSITSEKIYAIRFFFSSHCEFISSPSYYAWETSVIVQIFDFWLLADLHVLGVWRIQKNTKLACCPGVS